MLAFNNNPQLKADLVADAIQHRELDHYRAGTYGKGKGADFKACSIGCTVHSVNLRTGSSMEGGDHASLSEALGVPEGILRMADSVFEALPETLRPAWTERWLSAIPVGKDLSLTMPRAFLRMLDRLPEPSRAEVVEACKDVKPMLRDWLETGDPDIVRAKAAYACTSAYASASAYAYASAYASAYACDYASASAYAYASAYACAGISIELLADDLILSIQECA